MLVTTTFLEQTDPTDLRPATVPEEPGTIVRVGEVSPEFSRFLFTAVGGDWYWQARLNWTFDEWTAWLSRPGSETWVLWVHGTPAGFIELDAQPLTDHTQVEIAYFGLLPRFIGRGLGGHLLTAGVGHAWAMGERWPDLPPVRRIWLHTCTLDGEHALANYTARGFRPFWTQDNEEQLPAKPPGPWPDAH